LDIIEHFHASTPILGICLGHQALGVYFGAELVRSSYPQHGKVSRIDHTQHPLFKGIDTTFEVMRYHSLELKINSDSPLKSIAVSNFDNAIMAIAHETFPVIGIQFHPESIGTKLGMQLLENWSELKF
jgi:anthranilate synthase/aminodeoxychorismate synthase-like glutamine amidotransferase